MVGKTRAFVRRKRYPLLQTQGLVSGAQAGPLGQDPMHSVPPVWPHTVALGKVPAEQQDSYSHSSSSGP